MKYNNQACEKCHFIFQHVIWGTYLKVKAKNHVDVLQPIFNYSCLVASIVNKTRTVINIVDLE